MRQHDIATLGRAAALAGIAAVAFGMTGIAHAAGPAVASVQTIWIAVPASPGALQSITFTPPGSGYVVITTVGSVNYQHTKGTEGFYCVAVSGTSADTGGCTPGAGSDSAMRQYIASGEPTTVPGLGTLEAYSIVKTVPVLAGHSYTYYLNGYATGVTNTYLFQPSMTALYVAASM
jgi:hypothetical protein